MEDVLELYTRPYDPARPLVSLDETSMRLSFESLIGNELSDFSGLCFCSVLKPERRSRWPELKPAESTMSDKPSGI